MLPEPKYVEAWNGALKAVDEVLSKGYTRKWLEDLFAPDSPEFKLWLEKEVASAT